MKELRVNFLHQDWEDQVHNVILISTLSNSNMTFWNWLQHLLKLNCLLRGMLSAFDNYSLLNHLKAHLDNDLNARTLSEEQWSLAEDLQAVLVVVYFILKP